MAIRRPLVRVDGEVRQLPAGDTLPFVDAPTDGGIYARQNGAWVQIVAPPEAPVNTSPPVVTGAAHVGDTATTTNGTWTNSPTGYEYRWQVDPGTGWEDVSGETASTFDNVPAGEYRSAVRAQNATGWSDWAYSAPFVVTVAPTGTPFSGSWQADLSDADMTATRGTSGAGDYGHAWTDTLSGLFYLEVEVDSTNGEADVLIIAMDDPVTPQSWWNGGDMAYWALSSLKATVGSPWSVNYYGDTTYIGGPAPETADAPLYRVGIAVNAGTGACWLRSVSSAASGAWFGGGDPAAGTTPTFTVNNAEALRLAASLDSASEAATIVSPANHHGAAPTGFTAI